MPSSLDITITQYKRAFDGKELRPFETPRKLLGQGQCVCCACGSLLSIDFKFCKICHEWAIIIVQKEHKVYEGKQKGKQSSRPQKKN